VICFWVIDILFAFIVENKHSHSHGEHKKLEPKQKNSEVKSVNKNSKNDTVRNRKNKEASGNGTKSQDDQEYNELTNLQSDQRDASAYLFLLGDFSHNFADGLAIAAAFSGGKKPILHTIFA
jgi:zinc transporter ZupT